MSIRIEAYLEAENLLEECGCCGCLHPKDWYGDCRDDDNRYGDIEDYIERHNND
ncbi:hypothetical protein LCGC14_1974160 [marine sediment metagenome]|uniref:Uncharacterized protein n=1 Tax=marine sediment metagenome TaxID=412755 RepID=A0A0F9I7Y7_9ZZZZ